MFTLQSGAIHDAEDFEELSQIIGNCAQPLAHRAPIAVSTTMPAGATQATLTLNAYEKNGGEGAYGLALEVNGSITHNSLSLMGIPVGGIICWSGTAAALATITGTGYWAACDGTNGTPDLRDRFIVCKGSTYTASGGAATHDHGAATGSGGTGATGSSTTGITVNSHTGNTGTSGTGATGSSTTGITISDHAANNTGSGGGGTTGSGSTHSHGITYTSGSFSAGGSPGIATITSPTDNEASHTHTISAHTHTTPLLAHTVNEPNSGAGHTHTGPSHDHSLGTLTHTVNDSGHTHTGPSHTHSISSASNIPPYYALTFLMRIL